MLIKRRCFLRLKMRCRSNPIKMWAGYSIGIISISNIRGSELHATRDKMRYKMRLYFFR